MLSIDLAKKSFTPTYNPAPFIIKKAEGSWIESTDGKRYLDFSSGIAVNNLGHCHPEVVKAIQTQASLVIHSSNLFWNEPSMKLATRLTELSFADEVFLTNSGTEANEAALKLARKYFFDQGKPRTKYLAFKKAFHGRSFGSLSATEKEAYRKPYEPVVPGFGFIDFNSRESLNAITEEVAAVIFEPVQGEAGVYPCDKEFAKALRDKCNSTGSLLIADCIQVGMYRTDCLFGYESLEIEPNIVSLAKALGGGMPIGAILTTAEIGKSFQPGAHGTTFGGNPVSAASALAVLNILTNDNFLKGLHRLQGIFSDKTKSFCTNKKVKSYRLKGMMLGIDFDVQDINETFTKLRELGALCTKIAPSTLRILPPLIATEEEIDFFFLKLAQVFE